MRHISLTNEAMPEKNGNEPVEFSTKVSADEYERFASRLPIHGATAWFIRTALESFNKQLDEHPELVDLVKRAIEKMPPLGRAA